MKYILSTLLFLLLLPTSSFGAGKNAYTQCGIGGMIFKNTGWAAAISNIVWDLGSTATTSSSSTPSQCAGSGNLMRKMVYENYASVEQETAIGQGEHLNAMMNLLKCDSSIQSNLIQDVRADFLKSVENESYTQKTQVEKTEDLVTNVMGKASTKYSAHCTVVTSL